MPSYTLSTQPTQIAHIDGSQELTIRVLGAGTVLLSQSLSDSQNGVGISFVASDNIQRQKWHDELWGVCDDPATKVQIVFPCQGNTPLDSPVQFYSSNRKGLLDLFLSGIMKQNTSTCCKKLSLKSGISRLIGRNLPCVIIFSLFALRLHSQQDIVVSPTANPVSIIKKGLVFGSSGNTGVNNNFILTPNTPIPPSICVYAVNNNPTNTHTVNFAAFGTSDVSTVQYSATTSRWQALVISPGLQSTGAYLLNAASSRTFAIRTAGLAHIAIVLSGSVAAGGSPDTLDLYYSSASDSTQCGGAVYPFTVGISQFQASAYTTGNAWFGNACVTNPGNGYDLLNLIAPTGSQIASVMLPQKVRLSSTAQSIIQINQSLSLGSNCSNVAYTPANLQTFFACISCELTTNCSTIPVVGTVLSKQIVSTQPYEVDLSGLFVNENTGTNRGLSVYVSNAVTGTVCADIQWLEF